MHPQHSLAKYGRVPEWPKGADCKSAVTDFDGSNPSPPTIFFFAGMAELADALDSGSSESNFMQVQVLFPAPNQYNPNQIFQIRNGFGFFLTFLSQRYNPLDLASMVSV